jgi:hypothetical protein
MTKLEFANKIFFQWFFIRLARCSHDLILDVKVNSVSLLPDGSVGMEYIPKCKKKKTWYAFIGWIVPLTGWRFDYRYIGKIWQKNITKPKII